jgi:Subtilase family
MASLAAGTDTGVFPVLPELIVSTWGRKSGSSTRALNRVLKDIIDLKLPSRRRIIINMSLGSSVHVKSFWRADYTKFRKMNKVMKQLRSLGNVLFVVCAGNNGLTGTNIKQAPARFANPDDKMTREEGWFIEEMLLVGGTNPNTHFSTRWEKSNGRVKDMVYASFFQRCAHHHVHSGDNAFRRAGGTSGGEYISDSRTIVTNKDSDSDG